MPCKSCGGRSIRTTPLTFAVQHTMQAYKDADFKTVYYIGNSPDPIVGSFTNIRYGVRNYGEKMLLHINDFNETSFSYEQPEIVEQVAAQVFAKKRTRKTVKLDETVETISDESTETV